MSEESRRAGAELMQEMLGVSPVVHDPSDAEGYVATFFQEHIFGELWQRQLLDLRTRSLCTIAALVAGRSSEEELKNHVKGALANGASEAEVLEVIAHVAIYSGLSLGPPALRAAEEVLKGDWTVRTTEQS